MLKRMFLTIVLLFGVGLSQIAMASDLKKPMQDLNVAYNTFAQSKNTQQASKALKDMYKAVLISKKNLPPKLLQLRVDDEQVKVYQLMLDMLLADIDEASKMVDANRLDDAKKKLGKIDAIKNQGHQKFK